MADAASGPEVHATEKPLTLESLAQLNKYDIVGRELDRMIANGELADYDDEMANRIKDAIRIVRGVCLLAGVPLRYENKD